MGSLKEQLQSINEKFEQFLKVHEENTRTHSPFASSKAKEILSPATGIIEGPTPISATGHNSRLHRIEMSVFDGENPDDWILKVERYFQLYHISNEDKLEAAIISFKGEALLWYQWESKRRLMMLWEEMKISLLQ